MKKPKIQKKPISQVQIDPNNPRSLSKDKFRKLKESIKNFPEMLEVRPLVVADGYVIGGNMRLLAMKDLGYREVSIIDVTEWNQKQRDEFMIKDNISFGQWDWDVLANEWENIELKEWGLDVWQPEEAFDMDSFFEDQAEENEPSFKIVLEYSEEDYAKIQEALKNHSGSVESIVMNFLCG